MITGDELAFVRLAMRKRILSANLVREAVERKKWDTPNRSLPSILVDMGALDPADAKRLRRGLKSESANRDQGEQEPTRERAHATVVGRDRLAREHPDDIPEGRQRAPKKLGKYKVMKLLGAGAMGAVYHARDLELQRDVALKLLTKDGGAPSPRAIQRFKREARLAARLDHPNIVRVYEAGVDEGYNYIAMEMVSGRSVAELIALGEITPRRAVHICRKVAEAVSYAHEKDVIHRDLKPANILVEADTGEARVTDFGLAVLSEGGEDDRLTRTGAAVGTPAYMAPEQVRGQLKKIDGRTDIYAVGATLYEMLTGSPPFEAPTFLELAKQICDVVPPSPRKKNHAVPVDVATICLKALEKDKEARYQIAQDMADDLTSFLADKEIAAQRPTLGQRLVRWGRRKPALVAGLAGFAAVFLGALGYYASLPGTLEISSFPAGVMLKVDGKEVGKTPEDGFLKLELRAGSHELRFVHDDYLELAPGAESVTLGRLQPVRLKPSLVSKSGILRVETVPIGAQVTVRSTETGVEEHGITPYMGELKSGTYTVELTKPGFLTPPKQEVFVSTGGLRAPFEPVELMPDPAGVHVEADQDNVVLRRAEDSTRYVAPEKLPGGGRQEVVATKAGYLQRRLLVDVAPGTEMKRRVSLTPLVSYRVPLEGQVLGEPLVRDVDGDGAQDLIVLELGPSGARLVLLLGAGHHGAAFREPTTADVLIDAQDVNGDGVLDLVLGDSEHVEIRDGENGRPLASLAISAHIVAVARAVRAGAYLVYATEGGGLAELQLDRSIGRRRHPRPNPAAKHPPAVLEVGTQDALSTWVVAPTTSRGRGGALAWVVGQGRKAFVPLEGVDGTSRAEVVNVERGRLAKPWVVVLPARGKAAVLDPLRTEAKAGALYTVGTEDCEFTAAAGTVGTRGPGWLFLSDARAARTRVFAVGRKSAREVEDLQVPEGGVVLRPGRNTSPLLWTPLGNTYELAEDGESWSLSDDLTTDAATATAHGFRPVVADLDLDGFTEVLAPGPDRRSLVALAPKVEWLQWRVAGSPPRSTARGRLVADGDELVVVTAGSKVLGYAATDGRTRFVYRAPARVDHVAFASAEGTHSAVLYVAGTPEGGEPFLVRAEWTGSEWSDTWSIKREVSGLLTLPFDLDSDGRDELLVGGPLAAVLSASGGERWRDKTHSASPGTTALPAPGLIAGKTAFCVGASAPRKGRLASVVAHDPSGSQRWSSALERTVSVAGQDPFKKADPAIQLLVDPNLPLVVVISGHHVAGLRLTDGKQLWRRDEPQIDGQPAIVGGSLVGGSEPSLVYTRRDQSIVVLDVNNEAQRPRWTRYLAAGQQGVLPSVPVVIRKSTVREDAVAVVAPNGVLLFFALADGAYLGERRTQEGLLPWLEALRIEPRDLNQSDPATGSAADALLVATRDAHLVALRLDPLRRKRHSRRRAIREQLRRIALGEPFVSRAVGDLNLLLSGGGAAAAYLALGEAQMALGKPADALVAVKQVLDVDPKRPQALKLRAMATYVVAAEQRKKAKEPEEVKPFEIVEPLLVELGRIDAILAARAAVELSDVARAGDEVRKFLTLATRLAPVYGSRAHRRLGSFRFRFLASHLPKDEAEWRRAARSERVIEDILQVVDQVRTDFIISLSQEEDARARAAALVVTVLEYRINKQLVAEGERRTRLLKRARNRLSGLKATQQLETTIPPLLRNARSLAEACLATREPKASDAKELLRKIQLDRPSWERVLASIADLWR